MGCVIRQHELRVQVSKRSTLTSAGRRDEISITCLLFLATGAHCNRPVRGGTILRGATNIQREITLRNEVIQFWNESTSEKAS